MTVTTPWSDIWLSPEDWTAAFDAAEPGTPHNEARHQVWEELLTILTDKHDAEADPDPDPDTAASPPPLFCAGPSSRTGTWSRPSTVPGPSWRRRTWSGTCGRYRRTSACARPG